MSITIEECQDWHDVIQNLLAYGFDVNADKNLSQTSATMTLPPIPLLQAIALKKLGIAKLLLENGADVDKYSRASFIFDSNGYKNPFGGSPLLKAVDDNYIDGVCLLLSFGANPLQDFPSPLERAIQKGYINIVDVLVEASIQN